MNIGFREAMREEEWDCLFFHDVDLIPEDDRNTYICDTNPKHAAIAMDKFGYKYIFLRLSLHIDPQHILCSACTWTQLTLYLW